VSELKEKIKELCIAGLLTDGGHHKQWFLEEILKVIGIDLRKLRLELNEKDYDWDKGIPP